jgi:hypothetical protein
MLERVIILVPKSKTFTDEIEMDLFCVFLEEKEISYQVIFDDNVVEWEVVYPRK